MTDQYDAAETSGSRIKWQPTLSFGQALVAATMLVSVTFWAVRSAGQGDIALDKIKEMQASFQTQMTEMRVTLDRSMQGVQSQISNLPDYAARLNAVERSNANQDSSIQNLDTRLRGVETTVGVDSSRLDAIERASGFPPGRSPQHH